MKKIILMQKQMILTREPCVEHPFSGRNTQQSPMQEKSWRQEISPLQKNVQNIIFVTTLIEEW